MFDQLRTKEQLGYIVHTAVSKVTTVQATGALHLRYPQYLTSLVNVWLVLDWKPKCSARDCAIQSNGPGASG